MQFSSISPPQRVLNLKEQDSTGWEWAASVKGGQSAGNAGYFHGQDTGKNTYVDRLFMNG